MRKDYMNDPTYDIEDIKKNELWHIAWLMSECMNANAPIGWFRYLWVAGVVLKNLRGVEYD
jgi:hypothetical protein